MLSSAPTRWDGSSTGTGPPPRLYGWSEAEVLGQSLRDRVGSTSKAEVERLRDAMQSGQRWSGVIVAKRSDGRFVPSELTCGPLRGHDGAVVGMVAVAKDVTSQLATQAALRDNEERFRQVFDQSPTPMAIVGPDLRIQRPNGALLTLLGYDEGALLDRTVEDLTHPDDFADDLEAVGRLLRREVSSYQIQKRFIRSDGAVIVGRLTASAVFDEHGELQYGVGVVEDITASTAAYETIQEQQERLAMTLEAAGVATFELDLATLTQKVSDNYAPMLGLAPDEVPVDFDGILALVHPDDQAMFLEPTPDPDAAGDRFKVEFRMVPHGRTVWIESMGSFVRDEDGVPVALRGTIVDLTPKRSVEIRHIEAEERYRRDHRFLERRVRRHGPGGPHQRVERGRRAHVRLDRRPGDRAPHGRDVGSGGPAGPVPRGPGPLAGPGRERRAASRSVGDDGAAP